MKYLIRFIVFFSCLLIIVAPTYAKKQLPKKQKTAIQKGKKSIKTGRKTIKIKNQVKKNNKKGKKQINTEKSNLNTLVVKPIANQNKIDSVPEKVVTILSAFKPELKSISKIGFINATAIPDTGNTIVKYDVPSQNLNFLYQHIALVPRSFVPDSAPKLNNDLSVKVGFGSYTSHLLDLTMSRMDLSNNPYTFNIHSNSIMGAPFKLMNKSNFGLLFIGETHFTKSMTLNSQFFFNQVKAYRYGTVPDTLKIVESNYEQNYSHFGVSFGLNSDNDFFQKSHLSPTLKIERFNGINKSVNTWMEINSPLYFNYSNNTQFNLGLNFTNNHYVNLKGVTTNTSILQISPSFKLEKLNTKLDIGASPTLLNGNEYKINPIVFVERKLKDTQLIIKSGWHFIYNINPFNKLVEQNAWIQPSPNLQTTSIEKKFIQLDYNVSNRVDYSFNLSLNDMRNVPLYKLENPTSSSYGLKYYVIFEPRAIDIELLAKMRYQLSDQIVVSNSFLYKQFSKVREYNKPWGIVPLELKSSIYWKPNNKWIVDGDVNYWSAVDHTDGSNNYMSKSAFVLNAGFTYKLTKKWHLWAKGENLLDTKYERWSYYPSLGVQVIAGIIYSFRN